MWLQHQEYTYITVNGARVSAFTLSWSARSCAMRKTRWDDLLDELVEQRIRTAPTRLLSVEVHSNGDRHQ